VSFKDLQTDKFSKNLQQSVAAAEGQRAIHE